MTVDRLDEYFRTAAQNSEGQQTSATIVTRRLRGLVAAFDRFAQHLNEPTTQVGAVFILAVHARHLAACLLTLSGHLREVYPVLRSGLESAMYALVLEEDDDLREAWFGRDSNAEALKRVRRELNHTSCLYATVQRRNATLAEALKRSYEESITLGAHPSPMAVAGSLRIVESETRTEYSRPILGGSQLESAATFGNLVHYGANMLETVTLLMPERAAIHGIPQSIREARLPWGTG